jgi:hypothetical protein
VDLRGAGAGCCDLRAYGLTCYGVARSNPMVAHSSGAWYPYVPSPRATPCGWGEGRVRGDDSELVLADYCLSVSIHAPARAGNG